MPLFKTDIQGLEYQQMLLIQIFLSPLKAYWTDALLTLSWDLNCDSKVNVDDPHSPALQCSPPLLLTYEGKELSRQNCTFGIGLGGS